MSRSSNRVKLLWIFSTRSVEAISLRLLHLYQPDKYELENLKSIGLDTSDTVSLLEQICAGETRICLPVLNILPGGGLSQFDEYEVHVQFRAPDGSAFISPSGFSGPVHLLRDGCGSEYESHLYSIQ